MTSLANARAALQILLDDAGATVWTTAELDSHIAAALKDLSHYLPRELTATKATTADVREIDISATATDRIRIVRVELPQDEWPRRYRRFDVFGDELTILDDPAPDGSTAKLYYEAYHVINGTCSLPAAHDELLKLGAAWLACEQQAADATNSVNTGGQRTPADWAALARNYRLRYEAGRNPLRGIRVGHTYQPLAPLASESSDPGP